MLFPHGHCPLRVVAVGKKDNDDMDLGEGESWGEEQTSSLGKISIFRFSQLLG